ncbi:efflux RND transporter periplasmic adaptor subunit [Aeromonas veronii]|uniref:efflux RND transporter periplasmic adaptor subunit n=1 Tax=Aeromonas veronii TaxID=654 RepID=UPI00226CD591|nr:HlyD family efflux transporter periplasmic adaptor subunit [Aeromonas veronii]MCX9107344.1 HlyD family efflux transporter periplasmic adaptor subunit [Aeromonas veronii]MCX9123065.1 HlyD family efflux transporter periplasmic adaptor subunit [Aeromonas veronii]
MTPLPPLRDDLRLDAAAPGLDGAPQWVLSDAISGRYYKLTATALRLLRHWSCGNAEGVLAAANREVGLPLNKQDLQQLLLFLRGHDLIASRDPMQRAGYSEKASRRRVSFWRHLLHQYLFFRLPLWRPDPLLTRLWPTLRRLASLRLLLPWLLLAALFLLGRDWARYHHAFPQLFNLEGALLLGASLLLAKFCHELGHAFMAKRAGCRVRSMGVAFVVMLPMFYTDVSDAWRVQDRRARLWIGAGGVLAEMLLASLALLAWLLLPDGMLRSAALLLSSVTWVGSLLINLNPLMRFDGYFLLSDLWRIDNLQDRAFALCRWHLRELLFGYGSAAPEVWSPRMRRRLLLWGYASWVWRFILFLGIALTVYHFFFKLLGIALMAVEIGWFIALPIVRELALWWQQRQRANARRALLTAAGLLLVLGALLIPWRTRIAIPAMLEAGYVGTLYAPVPSRVQRVLVADGDRVEANQVLISLSSPDLDARLAIARHRVTALELELRRQSARKETASDGPVLARRLAEALTEYRGWVAQRERLQLRALQAGVVRDLAQGLAPGRWLGVEQPLLRIVDTGAGRVRGYVQEESLARLTQGARGEFIADDPSAAALPVRLDHIDATGIASLPLEALASDRGGPIGVRRDAEQRAVPLQAHYGVTLSPAPPLPGAGQQRGLVLLDGQAESLLGRFGRRAWALAIRESGF